MTISFDLSKTRLSDALHGVRRCPHCSIASPLLNRVWKSENVTPRHDGGESSRWAAYLCTSCGGVVSARGDPKENTGNPKVLEIFPAAPQAHGDLPLTVQRYLQQAFDTLHSPDAAAMVAGSAVDAMLKTLGHTEGSVYARIDKAVDENVLTKGMADWAHSVRLGSNRPRHADDKNPHVSLAEAKQSVEFAEALGNFLFVLTAKIERGIAAAEKAQAA